MAKNINLEVDRFLIYFIMKFAFIKGKIFQQEYISSTSIDVKTEKSHLSLSSPFLFVPIHLCLFFFHPLI